MGRYLNIALKIWKYKITKNLIIYLAVAPEFEKKGGLYLENCAVSILKDSPEKLYETFSGHLSYVFNPDSVEKLWNLSEQILKEHSKWINPIRRENLNFNFID